MARIDFSLDILKGTQLISSQFGNSMMYFDLVDENGQPVISQRLYNNQKPLYGLIESCHEGINFEQFYCELNVFQKL